MRFRTHRLLAACAALLVAGCASSHVPVPAEPEPPAPGASAPAPTGAPTGRPPVPVAPAPTVWTPPAEAAAPAARPAPPVPARPPVPVAPPGTPGGDGFARARYAFAAFQSERVRFSLVASEGDQAATRKASEEMFAARKAFLDAFAVSEWEQWSADTDAELMEFGLRSAGEDAFSRRDGARALRAFRLMVERLPEIRGTHRFPSRTLPQAYLLAGELDEAEREIARYIDLAPVDHKPRLLVTLGNVHCLRGDVERALPLYREAYDLVPVALRGC